MRRCTTKLSRSVEGSHGLDGDVDSLSLANTQEGQHPVLISPAMLDALLPYQLTNLRLQLHIHAWLY